jgi:uncharacterized SAM-binding protein YcdF (DUF218 family)
MAADNEIATKKYRRARWITLSLAAIVGLLGVIVFLGVGRWLVVQDPLEKAQAILVLSGGMPFRAEEAARLYREGYAPKVWLTHSAEPGATLSAMGLSYISEDAYDVRVLTHEGVPPNAIRLLQPDILNTADEISIASEALAQEKGSAVIIVTSKVHTRRARILWRRLAARRGTAIVRATSDDPFEPGRWWRTTADALDVVREVLGILNAWAGMPLRPER